MRDASLSPFELLLQIDHYLLTAEVMVAYTLAHASHEGQERDYSLEPYIFHPVRVAVLASRQPDATASHVASALLHDTLEDTEVTVKDLMDLGFSQEVIDIVISLTRSRDPEDIPITYDQFIESLLDSPGARLVKRCDVIDNLSTLPVGDRRVERYLKALSSLMVGK